MRLSFYALFFGLSLGGCRTTDETQSGVMNTPGAGPNWHRIMTCNGGDVGVDVDLNERRDFQLVISNRYTFNIFDQPGWTHGQIKNANERIYRGRAIDGRGVFDGNNFFGFFANGVGAADGDLSGFKVKRGVGESNHSGPWTKLTFTAVDLRRCGGQLRSNDFPNDCTIGVHEWNACNIYN